MNTVLEKIKKMGIVPVVVIEMRKMQCRWQMHFVMADLPAQK